jgi:hypothetical protein
MTSSAPSYAANVSAETHQVVDVQDFLAAARAG